MQAFQGNDERTHYLCKDECRRAGAIDERKVAGPEGPMQCLALANAVWLNCRTEHIQPGTSGTMR